MTLDGYTAEEITALLTPLLGSFNINSTDEDLVDETTTSDDTTEETEATEETEETESTETTEDGEDA